MNLSFLTISFASVLLIALLHCPCSAKMDPRILHLCLRISEGANELSVDDALDLVKTIFTEAEVYDALMRIFPNHFSQKRSSLNRDLTDDTRRVSICDGDCQVIPKSAQTVTLSAQLAQSIKNDKNQALCKKSCGLKYGLTCGSNGRTYLNRCWFDYHNCLHSNQWSVVSCAGRRDPTNARDAKDDTLYSVKRNIDVALHPVKRSVDTALEKRTVPGTTHRGRCVARGTLEEETNTKTLCVECNAKRDLGQDHYPRYLNEIICDNTNAHCLLHQGTCVQNVIYVNFKRDTRRVGIARLDEWTSYSQRIRNGCHCQLNVNSAFDAFI